MECLSELSEASHNISMGKTPQLHDDDTDNDISENVFAAPSPVSSEKPKAKRTYKKRQSKTPPKSPAPPPPSFSDIPTFEESPFASADYKAPPRKPLPEKKKVGTTEKEKDAEQKAITREIQKILGFQRSPMFREMFPESMTSYQPSSLASMSLTRLREIYMSLSARLMDGMKKDMVDNFFYQGVSVAEFLATGVFKITELQNLEKEVKKNQALFEADLTLAAIEIPDDYIPGPWTRIGWKVANIALTTYKKNKEMAEMSNINPG